MTPDMKQIFGLAFLFVLAMIGAHCLSCSQGAAGPIAAEGAYTGELLRCVDQAHTLAESKACRTQVNAKWQVTEKVADGGAR